MTSLIRASLTTTTLLAATLALASLGACAPDPRRQRALDALQLTTRALDLVDETSGSEVLSPEAREAIDPARADAQRWLEQAQQSIETWTDADSLAFRTMVPCLGRSLGTLRERLARHGRPIPESLRRAEAVARTATDAQCARRTRRRATAREQEVGDEHPAP